MRLARGAAVALLLLAAACASRPPEPPPGEGAAAGVYKLGRPYRINGRLYVPEFDPSYDRVGVASWYGDAFHGRPTANGELFDKERISAAHPTLPLPSRVRVTNLENGRSVELRVNDRGPFVGDRLIDLSQAAARELGYEGQGLARVRVQFLALDAARGTPPEPTPQVARAPAPPEVVRAAEPAAPPPAIRLAAAAPAAAPPVPAPAVRLAAAGPAPPPACGLGPHWVQVGAFADADRWQSALRTLARLDTPTSEPVLVNGRAAVRVRLGPAEDRGLALALAERARRLGFEGAMVVPAIRPDRVQSC
jgi:rare lipoprotein A